MNKHHPYMQVICHTMKTALTILIIISSKYLFSQNCNCEKNKQLNAIINCRKTIFKNGAEIFWSFNCDSSWLTFKHNKILKNLYSLDKELMELTGRLGYSSWKEFENSFLVENRVISGCCEPSELYLFNIENGKLISSLGTSICETYSEYKTPFVITLKDINTLNLTNLSSNKIFKIPIPKGRLEKTLLNSEYLNPESLFENIKLDKETLLISYKYKLTLKSAWEKVVIKLDANKYGIIAAL